MPNPKEETTLPLAAAYGDQRQNAVYARNRVMRSVTGGFVSFALGLLRPWRMFSSEQSLRQSLRKSSAKWVARPSASMRRKFTVGTQLTGDHQIVRITPKRAHRGTVLFVHGGAYVVGPLGIHWSFIERMVGSLQCQFVVPRYPLAPAHTVEVTMPFMLRIYRELVGSDAPLIVMGDSAGGGLSLALIQAARRLNLPMPAGLVLLSPWLDVTMTTPEQAQLEAVDPVLRRAGLRAAAKWYAGSMPLEHPWLSPINGLFDGLPPILVFGGDHDILVTDGQRLVDQAEKHKVWIEYFEGYKLFHCWVLLPLPESSRARLRIENFVDECFARVRSSRESSQNLG